MLPDLVNWVSSALLFIQDTWSQYQGVISVAEKTKPPGLGSSWCGVAKQLDCYGNCGATGRINLVTGDYVNTSVARCESPVPIQSVPTGAQPALA